jgi:hypothetical protein
MEKQVLLLSPCEKSEQGGSKFKLEKILLHMYMVSIFCLSVYLSVCLSVSDFDPNYLKIGLIKWVRNYFGTSKQKEFALVLFVWGWLATLAAREIFVICWVSWFSFT